MQTVNNMDEQELEDIILQLVKETCQHPRGSILRQKGLHKIIVLIQQTGKLLRGGGVIDVEEAFQQTWLYFCRNLCEASTAKEAYNANLGSVISWINGHLYYRIKDIQTKNTNTGYNRINFISNANGEELDPVNLIPAPPEAPPILEEIREWLQRQSHELSKIHIRNRPEVNCQVLIERRLPPETSWEDLSGEFGIPIPTLSSFYQRRCFPVLQNFGQSEGYIE